MKEAFEDWAEYVVRWWNWAWWHTLARHDWRVLLGELIVGVAVGAITSILVGLSSVVGIFLLIFLVSLLQAPVALEAKASARHRNELAGLQVETARLRAMIPTGLALDVRVTQQEILKIPNDNWERFHIWALHHVRITNLSHTDSVSLGFSFEATVWSIIDEEFFGRRPFDEYTERSRLVERLGGDINGPLTLGPRETVNRTLAFFIGHWRPTSKTELLAALDEPGRRLAIGEQTEHFCAATPDANTLHITDTRSGERLEVETPFPPWPTYRPDDLAHV